MSTELLTYFLSGALFLVVALGGALWSKITEEVKDQNEQIALKANQAHLKEAEDRWGESLETVKKDSKENLDALKRDNKELMEKIEVRYDRQIDLVTQRLQEQIRASEENIVRHMQFLSDSFLKEKHK